MLWNFHDFKNRELSEKLEIRCSYEEIKESEKKQYDKRIWIHSLS
jgi:hypothetical protein